MAAAVFSQKSQVIKHPKISVDSAGTSGWNNGSGASPASERTWAKAGYSYSHAASQFTLERFRVADLVLVMDSKNYSDVISLTDEKALHRKVYLLRDFDPAVKDEREIPDPYSLSDKAFQEVLDMIESATDGLIQMLHRPGIHSDSASS